MTRLISIDSSLEKQVKHKKCGAVVGYYQNEVLSYSYKEIDGGYCTDYYIICPHCGEKIIVK